MSTKYFDKVNIAFIIAFKFYRLNTVCLGRGVYLGFLNHIGDFSLN